MVPIMVSIYVFLVGWVQVLMEMHVSGSLFTGFDGDAVIITLRIDKVIDLVFHIYIIMSIVMLIFRVW